MKTNTTARKTQTVAEYAKAHRISPKVVRRQLRDVIGKKPKAGWKITPAIAKQIAA